MRKLPSPYSMSPAAASSALAATILPLAMILSATPSVAVPATETMRLPPVMPSGTTSESPCTRWILSASTPSRAEAIWRSAVSWPWPLVWLPTKIVTESSSLNLATAVSGPPPPHFST